MRPVLYPRLRLDLSVDHLLFAVRACRHSADDPSTAARALEAGWAPAGDGLATLSVRSAFALLLQVLRLPPQSEVLLSAVTIPDMARLVREQGLVPVPVDIRRDTLFPTLDALDRAYSPRARVLVLAHLLGGRTDLTTVAKWAHARGLLLVEDCAQGFVHPTERGSERADLTCYSFGTIKTLTAVGGALTVVRDPQLLSAMRAKHETWAVQSVAQYRRRLARAAALLAVQEPHVYRTVERGAALLGRDFHELIISAIRGFPLPPGGRLTERVSLRPCAALLAMLEHRLSTFNPEHLRARAARGEALLAGLPQGMPVLGAHQPVRTHWLVGVEVADRARVVARGLQEGFDLAGATNICALPRPAERPDLAPLEAERMMARVLFVPAHVGVPPREMHRLAAICLAAANNANDEALAAATPLAAPPTAESGWPATPAPNTPPRRSLRGAASRP